jgi:hypothetical protein
VPEEGRRREEKEEEKKKKKRWEKFIHMEISGKNNR